MNHSLMLAAIIKPQAHESFLVQQFFKNAAEVWASSPHLRSKLDLQMKSNKNLGEHRKNRNCLKNQKDVMRDKVSGAIAIPKASWGCASALPNQIQVVFLEMKFPITSRRQIKVFWSNNFSKMLARFRASSPDRCPQAAKSLCHAFGTRSGWWEKRQLFEAGRTRPLRLVKP